MEMAFIKVLNMSISASWLVLIVVLLRLALKRAPKWIRVCLWAMVAVRLVCPVSIESVMSLIPSTQTVPEEIFYMEALDHGEPAYLEIVEPRPNTDPVEVQLGRSMGGMQTWEIKWVLLWPAGMAAMLAYSLVSYFRLRRRVAASIELGNGIYLCDYIESPFILGIVKPRIYLPSAMDPNGAAHVLAHERAHLARHDHWWKPLGFALLTVHWFNPVMWLAYILLCRDIELACDEKVIKEMGSEDKRGYSEALLACSVPRRVIAACPLAFGEVGVKERVKGVLNYKKPGFWIILVAVVACAAVAVCFLTDPAGRTLAEEWQVSGGYESAAVTAGKDSVVLTGEDEISRVVKFLKSAQFDPEPISQNRIERARDYAITLSNGVTDISFCFDIYFSAMWVDDGVKPSLPYSMKKPEQVREFFEEMLDIEISNVTATEPENAVSFNAVILRMNAGSILVAPEEGSRERSSADQIWVSISNLPEETVSALQVGNGVCITYDGMIAETYPAQIHNVFDIQPSVDAMIREAVYSEITRQMGTEEIELFDPVTVGGYQAMGIEYGDQYGVVWLNDRGDLVKLTRQEQLQEATDRFWIDDSFASECEKGIAIIANTDITTLNSGEEWIYLFNYPAVQALDMGKSYVLKGTNMTVVPYDLENLMSEPTVMAEYSHGYANMKLPIPESWTWEAVEYVDDDTPFGIRFRPEGESEGWVMLQFWPVPFGVCGTGLVCADGWFGGNGYSYEAGLYDGRKYWSFLRFDGLPGSYVVTWEGEWFPEYESEVCDILGQAVLAEGIVDQETATLAAMQNAAEQGWADRNYGGERDVSSDARFDYVTGTWTVTLTKKGSDAALLIRINREGAVIRDNA